MASTECAGHRRGVNNGGATERDRLTDHDAGRDGGADVARVGILREVVVGVSSVPEPANLTIGAVARGWRVNNCLPLARNAVKRRRHVVVTRFSIAPADKIDV